MGLVGGKAVRLAIKFIHIPVVAIVALKVEASVVAVTLGASVVAFPSTATVVNTIG